MSSISASVGRGGANLREDVRLVQQLLNRHPRGAQPPLGEDGLIGSRTLAAIEAFQRDVVGMARPDGRVDPGGRTFAAMGQAGAAPAPAPTPLAAAGVAAPASPDAGLPPVRAASPLVEADYDRAAGALRCEVACIKAVTSVESGGGGFYPSGRPKILFEAHQFSRLTGHRYDASYPAISSLKWNRALYSGGEKEYGRLQKAMGLNRSAALQAASWGRFQIMGFNFKASGFDSVDSYVGAMYESEGKHLDAFVNFLKSSRLDGPLRERRWADFARGYNGPGYAANHYDAKLLAAYRKFGGTH
jgi:peptidoglycan hydrolase-like protein with peptidoglycan-binding domain